MVSRAKTGNPRKKIPTRAPDELGARVRQFRRDVLAETGVVVAADYGVPPGYISAWETGRQKVPLDYLKYLSGKRGASLSWLLWGTGGPRRVDEVQQLVALADETIGLMVGYQLKRLREDVETATQRYLTTVEEALGSIRTETAGLLGMVKRVSESLTDVLGRTVEKTRRH